MRLANFMPLPGVHCETTTLRNMLHHAGTTVSEAMLFGLGQGIDFEYWDAPEPGRTTPMLTGRTGPGKVSRTACEAMDVKLCEAQAPNPESARQQAVDLLDEGHVVGVTVDIYHLDYFSSRAHFAAHYIALYGMDREVAYVVDTEQQGGAQVLSTESLRRAQNSSEGFMPSPNLQMYLEVSSVPSLAQLGSSLADTTWGAIHGAAVRMLSDRGPKVGLDGIRTAASEMSTWQDVVSAPEELVPAVGRFWRLAGTGGANFRKLYREFLQEARDRLRDNSLNAAVGDFGTSQALWDEAIELLLAFRSDATAREQLNAVERRLLAIAEIERSAFEHLLDIAAKRTGC
jgi:hypothetical protein